MRADAELSLIKVADEVTPVVCEEVQVFANHY